MPWLAAAIPAILGTVGSLASTQFGKGGKVNVPGYTRTDPQFEQSKAISGNINALPQAAALSANVNEINQDQLTRLLQSSIPGYSDILAKSGSNLQGYLKGELPQDVVDQIKRTSAEHAVGGGFSGSAAGRNLTARDLGKTSLGLSQWATSYAPNWLASSKATGTARPFDPASMFVTPAEAIGSANQNNQGQYGRDVYAAQMAAAPDPTSAALSSVLGAAGGALANYGFSNMGGAGNGGVTGYRNQTYYPQYGGTQYGLSRYG